MHKKKLIVIGGPTAVGKTELAIQVAENFNTVIISADSRQIYKELNIGVAKPTLEQLSRVKHYFISHISITQDYSAYDYQKEVHQLLRELFKQHDVVVMAGGTGFYINAVLNGLNVIPQISKETKEKLQSLYNENGLEFLQKELAEKDPVYYAQVDVNNPVRLLRALEVVYETGYPFSYFLNDVVINKPDYFQPVNIFLNANRPELHNRINQRVEQMILDGLEEEVKNLFPYRHLKALNTVGYKEWEHYFNGKANIDSVIEQIKRNTRQYAKRQITWFTHQWKAKEFKMDYQDLNKVFRQILAYLYKKVD